ncbi:MAG: methyltransferase [Patescibacteria group bacterium]
MSWIIVAIIVPVPLFHLWLHALLSFWKKKPLLFYIFVLLIWIGTFLFFKPIDVISPIFFTPSDILIAFGFILMSIGAILVLSSIITLGLKRFFMWAVLYPQSVQQTRLISGSFKFIPHPAYTGYLLVALGNFLLSGKLYLALVFIFLFALTPIMIYFEEKELSARIHE